MNLSKKPELNGPRNGRLARLASLFAAFAAFLCLFLLPALAFAQDAVQETSALSRIGDGLLDIIVPIVVAAVGTLLSWLLLKLKEKTGLAASESMTLQLQNLCEQAVLRAAEWSRKKSKELGGTKVPGPEVLEVALNWAIDMANQLGLPEKGRAALIGLIEARLFELRRDQAVENELAVKSDASSQGFSVKPPQTV